MSTAAIGFLVREMIDRGISVRAEFPDYRPVLFCPDGRDWQEAAGTMKKAIQEMSWVFDWGVLGKVTGYDFLCCNGCGEVAMQEKAKGAPSQKPVCHMTPGCKGIYRRMPEIFVVDRPLVPWKGVTWTFDDGGTVVVPVVAKNGKSCQLEVVSDGVTKLVVTFKTKDGVSFSGTNVIHVKDGAFSWRPFEWVITPP